MQQKSSRKQKIIQQKPKPINQNILDLFLNQDLEHLRLLDGHGNQLGINLGQLDQEAAVFLSHLHSLGVEDLPHSSELAMEWRRF